MEATLLFGWESFCIFCKGLVGMIIFLVIMLCVYISLKIMIKPSPYKNMQTTYRYGSRRRWINLILKKAIGLGTLAAFIKQPNKYGAITYNKKGIGSG